jgi:hypothetical protein
MYLHCIVLSTILRMVLPFETRGELPAREFTGGWCPP